MTLFKQFCVLLLCAQASIVSPTNVFQAIREDNKIVIQQWLVNNPDTEIRNSKGRTPLIEAVMHKHYEMACWLLNAGADIYAEDMYGNRAYDYAVIAEQVTLEQRGNEFALAMAIVVDLLKSIELQQIYMHEIELMKQRIPNFKSYMVFYYPLYNYPELVQMSSHLQ